MAKYIKDTTELASKLKEHIGQTLTAPMLARIYFESIKTMPWRGAVRKVKLTAGSEFARSLERVKVKNVKRTGRDGETYDDIEFEQLGLPVMPSKEG